MPTLKKRSTTIDEYIATFPKDVQRILEEVRHTIHKAAPGVAEKISYQMPTFTLNGRYLVYFAAWKHHVGFYALPSGHAAFKKELAPYKGAKGSVRFPLDEPMPLALIGRMVKFRVKEVLANTKK